MKYSSEHFYEFFLVEVLGVRRGEGIRVGRNCARGIAPAAVGTTRRPLYEAPHQSDNYNGI